MNAEGPDSLPGFNPEPRNVQKSIFEHFLLSALIIADSNKKENSRARGKIFVTLLLAHTGFNSSHKIPAITIFPRILGTKIYMKFIFIQKKREDVPNEQID
jgi:hypothetical protein